MATITDQHGLTLSRLDRESVQAVIAAAEAAIGALSRPSGRMDFEAAETTLRAAVGELVRRRRRVTQRLEARARRGSVLEG